MQRIKIKYWIYIIAFFFSFIPLLVIMYFSYKTTVNELEASSYRTNSTYAGLKIDNLNQYFDKLVSNGLVIARSESISDNIQIMTDEDNFESIRNEAKDKLDRFLYSVKQEFEYEDVFITDSRGNVIYGDAFMDGVDLSRTDYIIRSLEGEQNWSSLAYNSHFDTNIIVLSTPIYTFENSLNPIATVNLITSQALLNEKVHDGIDYIGSTGNAFLVDENGILWTDTLQGSYQHHSALNASVDTQMTSSIKEAMVTGKLDERVSEAYKSYDGIEVFGSAGIVPIGDKNLGLIIEISSAEALQGSARFQRIALMIFAAVMMLTIITITILSKGISRPLNTIEAYASMIVANHKDSDLPKKLTNRKDEIGRIAKSIQIIVTHLLSREQELAVHHEKLNQNYEQLINSTDEIKRLNIELEYLAEHDVLTQLPNRRKFVNELEKEMSSGNSGAVALLDLDDFKDINDTMGHVYGDHVLAAIGQRLDELSKTHPQILVARYGGDEFLILIRSYESDEALKSVIRGISEALDGLYDFDTEAIKIHFSIGVSRYPEDANSTFELITYADIAMYQAKESPFDAISYYEPDMFRMLKRKHDIKAILDDAIKNDGFFMVYQPQLDIKTGMINAFEALLRLKHTDIGPGEFIAVAEESQQMIAIGRWVTLAVVRQIAEWQKMGYHQVKVAINFSLKQLEDQDYTTYLEGLIKEYDISPGSLEIEITESILIEDPQKPLAFLKELKALGINLALDDFGSGYSSLRYLTYFNLSKIKLDKAFNDYFIKNESFETIEHIIEVFHSLGLLIVAEGVEGQENCNKYGTMGCDYIQSYYVSRPISADLAEKYIGKQLDL